MSYYRIRKVNNSETVRRKAEDYIGKNRRYRIGGECGKH